MENKLFSSTLAKKKELKTYLVLFWDNAEYLGLYLACTKVYIIVNHRAWKISYIWDFSVLL